jgi:pimeloyl-ACP methyl ester carboxylesterase
MAMLLTAGSAAAQNLPPPPPSEATTPYLVFFRGQPVGREDVAIIRQAEAWIVRGTSRQGPPIDITTRVAEVIYDADWHPKSMLVDGVIRGQDVTLKTTFADGKASNIIAVQGAPQQKVDTVSADTVVLPNAFLGSYLALGKRLAGKTAGSSIPAYIAPQVEVAMKITAVATHRIDTAKASLNATAFSISIVSPPPAPEVPMQVWIDKDGNLLRISIPSQMLEMAREDIAAANSRTAAFTAPGDETVVIQANGFNLAGTITKPAGAKGPVPAVILVGGSGPTDRDETVAGIPVFGHLARDLSAAGFFVVRYDKRGVGLSGGRTESVNIYDYAEDVRSVFWWLEKRKDVDKKRITVIGHSEGAAVSLIAAAKERDIARLVLMAGLSTTGADLVLEQQKHALSLLQITDGERRERTELQTSINQAVITGKGWDKIPEYLRRAADTPWFLSFLTFDASKAMKDVRQPILIVQGELDKQVPPHHADALAEDARARKDKADVQVVKIPGVNHLFVPATTGEVSEYATLGPDAKVSGAVATAIAEWLKK